jgi:hypothetical protein
MLVYWKNKRKVSIFAGGDFPMICFCDTPIMRVSNHSRVYGK